MAASSKTASARSDIKLVEELADILDKSGLAELEYETDAVAIRLSRVTSTAPVVAPTPVVNAPAGAPASATAPAEPSVIARMTMTDSSARRVHAHAEAGQQVPLDGAWQCLNQL